MTRAARRRSSTPGMRRRPARHALPRHLRPGARQHLRRAAGRHHDVRRERRRPRRLPLRQERHRQPRHRGPGLDAARPRHRAPASTSSELVATSAWMAGQLGRPSPSAVVRALAGDAAGDGSAGRRRVRHNPAHELASSTCTSVHPRPARRTSRTGSRSTPAALAAHDVHVPTRPLVSPGLFHFRAALDLLGQDWGGAPGHAEGDWDALVKRVRRRSGTVVVSHEILAPADRRAGRPRDARPRRQRGARRLLRARPGPAAAGGLAGERQAGPPLVLPARS